MYKVLTKEEFISKDFIFIEEAIESDDSKKFLLKIKIKKDYLNYEEHINKKDGIILTANLTVLKETFKSDIEKELKNILKNKLIYSFNEINKKSIFPKYQYDDKDAKRYNIELNFAIRKYEPFLLNSFYQTLKKLNDNILYNKENLVFLLEILSGDTFKRDLDEFILYQEEKLRQNKFYMMKSIIDKI